MSLQLIFGIHRATHRIGLYIQRHVPGMTQGEAHILCHLHEAGECAIADLHRAFAHKRSTLTSVLDRLAGRKLITREVRPEDRRSFVVALTAAGRKKAAQVHRLLEELEAGVLESGDRKSTAAFQKVLSALGQRLAK
jgi:DNA-binding MarR family transcriptional regulator